MFGYVTIRKDDLKVKDYNKYQAYYCGLCQDIKEAYGKKGQAMLTFDMTFLSILLTGLYECETKEEEHYCFLHPGKKHKCLRNKYTKYCADMNVLLAYYNLLDDWEDEKKPVPLAIATVLKKDVRRLQEKYPRQAKAIEDYLQKLKTCEQEACTDLDRAAADTGEMLGEIYVWKEDVWADTVRKIGCAMGRFIYRMDAYEDIEKDSKKGNYNPWTPIAQEKDFDDRARQILIMEAAEASRAAEEQITEAGSSVITMADAAGNTPVPSEKSPEVNFGVFLVICGILVVLLLLVFLLYQIQQGRHRKRRRKNQSRKVSGDNRNHPR